MADYSVSEAFQEIESYLISSMMRNMSHHLDLEKAEGISYTQWQAEQLAALAEFRTANRQQFNGYFSRINTRIEEALRKAYALGGLQQEAAILEALQNGWSGRRDSGSDKLAAEFFRINERKLNSYIKAVMKDMRSAETALLRMADDQYRKAIFNAGVAYNTGVYTLPQAIDAAAKDYLSRGIACIEYKNGARVLIDTYAEMALRTSATRCYLQGESAKRDEWGINTVIVNRRGSACPKCLQYVGKVFYDDVYGNLPVPDGRYPKLSEAIKGGLYHPNCKDIHTTYFEGISDPPKPLTADEEHHAAEVYALEQQQRYNERQIRRYRRLAEYTLDPEQKKRYSDRLKQWEKVNAKFVAEHGDVLKRRYEREEIRDLTVRVDAPPSITIPRPSNDNVQFYKPVKLDINDTISTKKRNSGYEIEISLHRIMNTHNIVYLSDNAKIKPRTLHDIDMRISDVYKLMNVDGRSNLPKVCIISNGEMGSNAPAAYNAVYNVIYVNDALLTLEKTSEYSQFACYDNKLSTFLHECLHWADAEDYRRKYGNITADNYRTEFLPTIRKMFGKRLAKIQKSGYNIFDISDYAYNELQRGHFDEVYTEYRVLDFLTRR